MYISVQGYVCSSQEVLSREIAIDSAKPLSRCVGLICIVQIHESDFVDKFLLKSILTPQKHISHLDGIQLSLSDSSFCFRGPSNLYVVR